MDARRAQALATALSETAELVRRWRPLADCHTAEFLSHGLWDEVVPTDLRRELDAADPEHVLAVFRLHALAYCSDKQPYIAEHCSGHPNNAKYFCRRPNTAEDCSSESIPTALPHFERFLSEARSACTTFSALTSKLADLAAELRGAAVNVAPLPLMCVKKQHEVRAMAALVSCLAAAVGSGSPVVDLGSGKGYLGAAVARPGYPVLGLDVSDGNSRAALARADKLQTAKGSSHAAGDQGDWLHTATVGISVDTDVSQLVAEHFPQAGARLTLAGLHTCGDLAATAVRLFLASPTARALCLVGCCYNLLSEPSAGYTPFTPRAVFTPSEEGTGFPLSHRMRGYVLGRNARMLASQSLERSLDDTEQMLRSVRGLHWRALLQTLLPALQNGAVQEGVVHSSESQGSASEGGAWKGRRVGRLAARCSSFPEYACRALDKLGVREQPSAGDLVALEARHEAGWRRLRACTLLRLALAPVVERLVLLDRAQLLVEQGITRWFLVQLFTPLVSPRCFALVALKDPAADIRDGS